MAIAAVAFKQSVKMEDRHKRVRAAHVVQRTRGAGCCGAASLLAIVFDIASVSRAQHRALRGAAGCCPRLLRSLVVPGACL